MDLGNILTMVAKKQSTMALLQKETKAAVWSIIFTSWAIKARLAREAG